MIMRSLLKNWLFQGNNKFILGFGKSIFLLAFFISFISRAQSVGNFVNNGSFEEMYSCSLPNPISKAKYWMGIDSIDAPPFLFSSCSGFANVPVNGFTYQWPKTGSNYATSILITPPPFAPIDNNRSYLKNRLKTSLTQGKTYCVKFFVNVTNNSTYGGDSFGAFFADSSLDTITKGSIPLTFITPQIYNQSSNMLTDTLGWIPITGTFVASGFEKYMVIGNFKSDAMTNTVLINPDNLPVVFCDVCIDDVSCIEMNLTAFAGRDTTVLPGSNVFIGREPDFALDSGCIWYKLPNMSTPIATISGMWVNPTTTSTYVVKQTLDCSPEKWDTVIVKVDPTVGLAKDQLYDFDFNIFPNPASENIEISSNDAVEQIVIRNQLGEVVLKSSPVYLLNVSKIDCGSYIFELILPNSIVRKRMIIIR